MTGPAVLVSGYIGDGPFVSVSLFNFYLVLIVQQIFFFFFPGRGVVWKMLCSGGVNRGDQTVMGMAIK